MEIDAYAAWAAQIAGVTKEGAPDLERLSYLGLGLAGEAGEVADLIKKRLRDGEAAWKPDRIAEELGDLAYYWAALCVAAGQDPRAVLAASYAKIDAIVTAARSPAPPAQPS